MDGKGEIIIYQTDDGKSGLDVRLEKETIWLSQKLMADLFDKDSDTIGLHIKNIHKEKELQKELTTEDFPVVQKEGKRSIARKLSFIPGRYICRLINES